MDQFAQALAAIDAANAADPTIVTVRDRTGPKELVHAELVSGWVERLHPEASDALKLAARGHHFRRWTSPRASYPSGRTGYLRWRKALHAQQAHELGAVISHVGYDEPTIERVQALVRKEHLGRDDEAQVLEDALCLVFLETQLADVAARLENDTLQRVVVQTARKMSGEAVALIPEVPMAPGARRASCTRRWRAILSTVTCRHWPHTTGTRSRRHSRADVHRVGPYRDVFDGREAYAAFLEQTVSALSGYKLSVHRMTGSGDSVVVELRETVDDGDAQVHTDEVVVFDVAARLIANVAVYLRTSERAARD